MKLSYKLLTIVFLFSASQAVAYAQQMEGGMKQGKGMHKKMMGKMSGDQKDAHMRMMQDHMLTLHELSNKIIEEQDPTKKQELKDQQLEIMKTHRRKMMEHIGKMKN